MFKKSNRNFRQKKAETSSDEDSSQNSKDETSAPQQATSKKTSEPASTVLSFSHDIHDDEKCEEFKVKKSRESRRIAKELKKSKKEKLKQLNTNEASNSAENDDDVFSLKRNKSEPQMTSEDVLFSEGIRVKPLNINREKQQQEARKQAKYLINKYGTHSDEEFENVERSDDEEDETTKLERLRREMESLNGEETEQIEEEQDDRKRSMKLMLKVGIIPDAAMIHEFRKKRELARQGDYIPIDATRSSDKSKSRLVREDDENDLSEDEEGINDMNRMSLNFKNKIYMERQMQRDNFLAYENGSDNDDESNKEDQDEEEEDEEERWEKEQILKGVQISQKARLDFNNHKSTKKQIQTYLLNANIEQEPMDLDDTRMYDLDKINNLPEISFLSIKTQLRKNINLLNETKEKNFNEHQMRLENLNANKLDLENMKKLKPNLDKQYVFYQEMKSYLEDFIECYNEKLSLIESASLNYLSLMRQRAERITSRRQQDYKDQNVENSLKKSTIDSAHESRMREREARRANKKSKSLRDGLSSDEDDLDLAHQIDEIKSNLNQLVLNDVNEEFYRLDLIKQRFEKWKQLSLDTYRTAYATYSLPKLFSPLVKFHLVAWNPLEDSNSVEQFGWFKELITYDRENLLKCLTSSSETASLDDYLLVPHIIEKTLLERLIEFCAIYDPMSTHQTTNLTTLVSRLISDYPTLNSKSENTKRMFDALANRIRACLDNDIYIPLYPKQLVEERASNASMFFYRQFWQCAKLYSNLLKWKNVLSDRLVKEFTLDCLLNRYLMIGLQSMEFNLDLVETIELLVSKLPSEWLTDSIPQFANLIRLLKRIGDASRDETVLKRTKCLLTRLAASDL